MAVRPFNIAEFTVTSILAAKYVIELTWSQLQQTSAGITYSIEAGQTYCTDDQVHIKHTASKYVWT